MAANAAAIAAVSESLKAIQAGLERE